MRFNISDNILDGVKLVPLFPFAAARSVARLRRFHVIQLDLKGFFSPSETEPHLKKKKKLFPKRLLNSEQTWKRDTSSVSLLWTSWNAELHKRWSLHVAVGSKALRRCGYRSVCLHEQRKYFKENLF